MKKKFFWGLFAILFAVIGIAIVLANEKALIVHPKGIIAQKELSLIILNIILMLIIIVPTYLLLFWVVWKYCIKRDGPYDPDHSFGAAGELAMWGLPTIIVVILSIVTWNATHDLNPYQPIDGAGKPLTVQVVALDWKWVFIYPDLGIATQNLLHIPEKTQIHLRLTADGAPMNSFWIPQLSGQIYSMTGMSTQLHLMAEGAGKYAGRAVEINGEGYSDMTFSAVSTSEKDFEDWVQEVKKSPSLLTKETYGKLVPPFVDKSVILFSDVEKDLYHQIIHKYMDPAKRIL